MNKRSVIGTRSIIWPFTLIETGRKSDDRVVLGGFGSLFYPLALFVKQKQKKSRNRSASISAHIVGDSLRWLPAEA